MPLLDLPLGGAVSAGACYGPSRKQRGVHNDWDSESENEEAEEEAAEEDAPVADGEGVLARPSDRRTSGCGSK